VGSWCACTHAARQGDKGVSVVQGGCILVEILCGEHGQCFWGAARNPPSVHCQGVLKTVCIPRNGECASTPRTGPQTRVCFLWMWTGAQHFKVVDVLSLSRLRLIECLRLAACVCAHTCQAGRRRGKSAVLAQVRGHVPVCARPKTRRSPGRWASCPQTRRTRLVSCWGCTMRC